MMTDNTKIIFDQIQIERIKQDTKWGTQNHDPQWWMNILMEEVGEVSKALLESSFTHEPNNEQDGFSYQPPLSIPSYRNELIHVAAVTVAMIECYDKRITENL